MAKITATFLGTGTSQGIPVIACSCEVCQSSDPKDNRTRTSLLLTIDGKNVVIDSGPDFRQQMLRENCTNLEAILFTHEHKDHIAGLDDVRAFNYISRKAMQVYCTHAVHSALKREFQYVFDGTDYPGIPQVNINLIDQDPIFLLGEQIVPLEVMHYKMPVKAFRIRNFTYITDANFIDEENMKKLEGTEVMVINALRREPHISHFTLAEALELVNRIRPKKTYLTHISHMLGKHAEVSDELPGGVELAYDGLTIDLA